MNPLRVDPADLGRLSDQIDEFANTMGNASTIASPVSAESWQSSASEAAKARAGANVDRTALTARMRSTAEKVAAASSLYLNTDTAAASTLAGQAV